jgi:sugar phosphate permease
MQRAGSSVPPQINPQTRQPISNQNVAGAGSQVGNAAGGFVDQLFKTVLQNPMVFLVGGIGFFLYMQEPHGGTSRR